jgi:hypothetical protein
MLTTDKILEITATTDLFTELNDEKAETISGGREVFTIRNWTNVSIGYNVDDEPVRWFGSRPGGSVRWTTYRGGIVSFDKDIRRNVNQNKKYNLANGRFYQFQYNKQTPNPYDIDLYRVV